MSCRSKTEPPLIRLETDNLIIRNHTQSDWEYLYEYLSLPEIYEFEPGEPISAGQARAMIADRSRGDDFLAVALKDDGRMIGHLYFHQSEPEEFMTWELGYIFNPAYQNKGYCTEASSAILQYAFGDLDTHRVEAFCNPLNIPSWRVMEKIGMEREGFFRQKAFFRKDREGNPLWHDCYAYGILNNREDKS